MHAEGALKCKISRLENEKNSALITLEAEVESLSEQILEKIFV